MIFVNLLFLIIDLLDLNLNQYYLAIFQLRVVRAGILGVLAGKSVYRSSQRLESFCSQVDWQENTTLYFYLHDKLPDGAMGNSP